MICDQLTDFCSTYKLNDSSSTYCLNDPIHKFNFFIVYLTKSVT